MQVAVTDTDPQSYASGIFARNSLNPAVVVADGHGVKISVRRGHLVIEDGLGATRRTRRIPRVPREVARLVILSQDGFITLDAVQWCAAQDIGICQYDRDGRCLVMSPGSPADTHLLRVQALADYRGPYAATGRGLVNRFTAAKIDAQAACIRDVFRDEKTAVAIARHVQAIQASQKREVTTGHEGKASELYWRVWRKNVYVPFPADSLADLPAHWYSFNGRASGHNIYSAGSPNRNATDPVNAILNFSYAILESEAVRACNIVGLNPDLGFTHGDVAGRHGMALDLMEVARPIADRAVLSLLDSGSGIPYASGKPAYIKPLWFSESATGNVRLVAPLTHMVSEQVIPAVAPVLARYAEMCARELAHVSHSHIKPGAPLTMDKRFKTPAKVIMAADLTVEEVVPDSLWESIRPLIPALPGTPKPGAPRADPRTVLAAVICHEIYGASWMRLPPGLGIERKACQRRLADWKLTGVWDEILPVIQRSGRTAVLSAV